MLRKSSLPGRIFRLSSRLSMVTLAALAATSAHAVTSGLDFSGYGPNPSYPSFANTDFSNYTAYQSFFSGLTADFTGFTSDNSVTMLDFSNSNYGSAPAFAVLGYNAINNYATRMQGFITITDAGIYTFGTTSDDGSVLYIDGTLVVNNNQFQGATRATGTVSLTVGEHTIDIGYYDGGGGEGLLVDWNGPDTSSATDTLPNSVLAPVPEPAQAATGLGLLALGAAGVSAYKRRRRQKAA